MILSILLTILKIIGVVLLTIFSVLVLILVAVLVFPIRYYVSAAKSNKIDLHVKVTWLLGIVQIIYEVKDSEAVSTVFKLFGVKLKATDGKGKTGTGDVANKGVKAEGKPPDKSTPDDNPRDFVASQVASQAEGGSKVPDSLNVSGFDEYNKDTDLQESRKKIKRKKDKHEKVKHEKVKHEKVKHEKVKHEKVKNKDGFHSGALGTIKKIWVYNNKKAVLHQTTLFIKRIIKCLTKVKISAFIVIGSGEPHTTGFALAAISALSGLTGFDIAAYGDFENKALTGRALARGRIYIGSLVWAALLFVLNRNIWPIIKENFL